MSLWTKKLCSALILVVVLVAVLFAYLPAVYVAESSDVDEVLVFLEEVVGLDVAEYDVTQLGTSVTYPDWLDGLAQVTGKYAFESETGKIDVLFKFRNNTLSWCLMRILEGSPHYTESQPTDIHGVASSFLQKYQEYSGDSELEAMRNMLDLVDVTENSTKTVDNLKLTVSVNSFSSCLDWRYTLDGADCGGVDVCFRNGHFYAFGDDRSYYQKITL
jgi:hypothetical protein